MTSAEQQKTVPLRIEGEMSIYKADELKTTLLSALGKDTTLEIDLSGVTELDTAGLQLLMLAKKTAQAAGGDLRLTRHSSVVADVFELLNVGAYFDDLLVMPSRTATSTSSTKKRNGY